MKHYDIVIAGGAMAGATLALALDGQSHGRCSIAVIEPYPADEANPGFDARSIALAYGTVQQLRAFSLWDELKPFATPIQAINVSDRGHAGMTDFLASEHGVEALGYVVELADVGQLFHRKLKEQSQRNAAGIDFLCPDAVEHIARYQDENRLTLASGKQISCQLLVAADGAASACCDMVRLPVTEHDFEQVAVITNIVTELAHQGQAFERFTEYGPLALLPMSENRMSLVWCMSPHQAEAVAALSEHAFLNRLQEAFGWRLGAILQAGGRAAYPLTLKQRPKVIAHRFAAVGNAAQTLHPVAGQGFNLGMRDVATLADLLVSTWFSQDRECLAGEVNAKDVGEYRFLNLYQKRREQDRSSTINLTYGLVEIFSNNLPPFVVARNLGLMAMDTCAMLKSPFLLRTMGLVER